MKATARPTTDCVHPPGRHPRASADRGRAGRAGGDDDGSEPAGAARREPGLLHGDHDGDVRQAQGLGHRTGRGPVRVHARRARLPDAGSSSCCGSRAAAARSRSSDCSVIAAKCPVHRTLDGEVMFTSAIELVERRPLTDRVGHDRLTTAPSGGERGPHRPPELPGSSPSMSATWSVTNAFVTSPPPDQRPPRAGRSAPRHQLASPPDPRGASRCR